ncbi:hypothetical protein HY990_03170 [Candidatus Micrarchaeota archaeon]|nr:hypothetical protein [Candidatus Micrarchaeota archaeon]
MSSTKKLHEPTATSKKKRHSKPIDRINRAKFELSRALRATKLRLEKKPDDLSTRAKARTALILICKANLDPLLSLSAADLAVKHRIFGHLDDLLKIIGEGANPDVAKICAREVLRLSREISPAVLSSYAPGRFEVLASALLIVDNLLSDVELRFIRSNGAPLTQARADLLLSARLRMRSGDEDEIEF